MKLLKRIIDWFWNVEPKEYEEVVEPYYPAVNCYCYMHPSVWCPVHDGDEEPIFSCYHRYQIEKKKK